jgi:diguanylate cyclase (GGDEF)-like protein
LVRGIDGKPSKMIIIVRDISQRKQAEKQIQSLIHELEVERDLAQLNSLTDSLTNLANRRYFDEVFNNEFSRVQRTGDYLSLIMIDVDHFKKYNDLYGHLAGDDCLRQIGLILMDIVSRTSDTVARFGGEEFIVVLPKTDSQGANALAERIRKSVEALAIQHRHSEIIEHVTISLGVVTVKTEEMSNPEEVLLLVDKAMYQAKQNGRNKVVFLDDIRRIS